LEKKGEKKDEQVYQCDQGTNNITFTENAHMAYKSTAFSKVLDMYGIAGAMRRS
jgi:hypothetical protein